MQGDMLIIVLVMMFLLLAAQEGRLLTVNLHRIRKKKRGRSEMTELIKNYIGKECLIYTCMSSLGQLTGVIKSCRDGWLEIETKDGTDIINCEYVLRIKEYPKNKKGKRKSVVFD